jgi:hypothetical protein
MSDEISQILIRLLREFLRTNNREMLRSALKAMRDSKDPEVIESYERAVEHPALRDLIPH